MDTMLSAIRTFMRGVFSLHPLWQIWVNGLVVVNGLWPLFFVPETATVVTIVGLLTGAALGFVLTHLHGFSKVLGLMHAPWVPMVVTQVMLHPGFAVVDHYVIWLTTSIVISVVSLLIDVCDVIVFLRGRSSKIVSSE